MMEMLQRVVYWNVSSEKGGTGVGDGSACGANVLNFCKAKQERESAIWFLKLEYVLL